MGNAMQYSLVNPVWDAVFTGSYGGTIFPGGIRYSLVDKVCMWGTIFTGIQDSL